MVKNIMDTKKLKQECEKLGWEEVETKVLYMWSCKNSKWRMNLYLTTGTVTIQPLIGYGTKSFREADVIGIMKLYSDLSTSQHE